MASNTLCREDIERIIGSRVCDIAPFKEAVVHKSMQRALGHSCERLELLGDACINLVVAEMLMQKYPQANEGFITRVRVKLVSGKQLSLFAKALDLQRWLVLSNNARHMQIHANDRILEDIFESWCGAIFVDSGYDACRAFVVRVIEQYADIDNLSVENNHKDTLARYAQQNNLGSVQYTLAEAAGPAHRRVFTTSVSIGNRLLGTGTSSNKKSSEMCAALAALGELKVDMSADIVGIGG